MQPANVLGGIRLLIRSYAGKLPVAVSTDRKITEVKVRRYGRMGKMDETNEGALCLEKPDKMMLVVGHNKKETEFYIKLTDETLKGAPERAVLQYCWVRPGLVDLHHTGVPDQFRHRGIAARLAKAVLDHFVSNGVNMRLTCTYLQKYVRDNPIPRYMSRIEEFVVHAD